MMILSIVLRQLAHIHDNETILILQSCGSVNSRWHMALHWILLCL